MNTFLFNFCNTITESLNPEPKVNLEKYGLNGIVDQIRNVTTIEQMIDMYNDPANIKLFRSFESKMIKNEQKKYLTNKLRQFNVQIQRLLKKDKTKNIKRKLRRLKRRRQKINRKINNL